MMFPAYAGGKFISNCLCLSKHCLPMYEEFDFTKVNDYEYRLDTVLKTLPHSNNMAKWLSYEFGEHNRSSKFYKTAKSMNLRCFRTMHSFDAKVLSDWNPCEIVILTYYDKFRKLAYSLKNSNKDRDNQDDRNWGRYNQVAGANWPAYEEMLDCGFDTRKLHKVNNKILIDEINEYYPIGKTSYITHLFDQSTIFDKELFLNEMSNLYFNLNLDDFDRKLTCILYERYAILHNITNKELSWQNRST